MTATHWIICERSTRWAAALRMALSVDAGPLSNSTTLHEVRSLAELNDQLRAHPRSLVLTEVTQDNIEAALAWLQLTTSQAKHALAIALLDTHRMDDPVRPLTTRNEQDCPSGDREALSAALREAGAADVVYSPRQIRPILTLGQRHAASCRNAEPDHPGATQSFEDWAWSLLPWQDAGRRIG
jgi:hypothetical protein